jgi:hypothetical protein
MPLAAGSELRDELLGLVKLAAEPVPPLGRALRERLARVAGVQLADGGHALPLPGPELPYGRRPLRIAAPAFPSRPRESHRSTQYPSRGSRLSGLASPAEWRGSHAYPSARIATSSRRSPWAEPTRTSGWGRISYHVGVDLRPRKLAGLVWGVDAPIDFTQPPLAAGEPGIRHERRTAATVSASARTATTGSEGEPRTAAIGRGSEPDSPTRLPRQRRLRLAPATARMSRRLAKADRR